MSISSESSMMTVLSKIWHSTPLVATQPPCTTGGCFLFTYIMLKKIKKNAENALKFFYMQGIIVYIKRGGIYMIFIAYFCIPVGLFLGGLAMLAMIGQPTVTTLGSIGYLVGGILFFLLLGGYIYFLWRGSHPGQGRVSKEKQENFDSLIDELYRYARSDDYVSIYAELPPGTMNYYDCIHFKSSKSGFPEEFSFEQYGYAPIARERMPAVFNALRDRLDGRIVVNISSVRGSTLKEAGNICLLLGDAKKRYEKGLNNKSEPPKKLKEI